ncbi:DEAD/DEAH box helicase [Streptomyces mirabilis]|uniref:DEAD/DEAH box helicase n=1 Tax=Streptomyces mirabilis TaxID=68239 RepID=UPI00367E5FE1
MSDGHVQQLVALLRERGPMASDALLLAARELWPGVNRRRLAQLVQTAEAAGLVVASGGVAEACASAGPEDEGRPKPGALRAVVVDVEAAVRASAQHPGGERRIYQVGAVRLSGDAGWVGEAPEFAGWLRLPDADWEALVRGEDAVAAYRREARDAVEVLGDFREWLGDADVLVAFNGTLADFGWIDAECARTGLPAVDGVRRVDALYVVHAVWPWLDSYRLGDVAAAVGVNVGGGRLHDALVDARVTALVLAAAAREVTGWPMPWRRLVSAAGAGSAGWELVESLASGGTVGVVDDEGVAELLAEALRQWGEPVRSRGHEGSGRAGVELPVQLLGMGGRVDPHRLAMAVTAGREVERRPAQQQMAAWLSGRVEAGRDGMCEAPTGTGKSLAVLAVALDWLAADPGRRVVVSTFTRQLQGQLAGDVVALARIVPGLESLSDVVKGQRNRVSLRALVAALVDAAEAAGGGRARRARFVGDVVFREVLVWLVRRLATARGRAQVWSARSVDVQDLPAFLVEYVQAAAGGVLPLWLASVSQEAEDYRRTSDSPLAEWTDSVGEAVAGHRLVIANHALLQVQADGFDQSTLLVADEAHALEQAVTAASTAQVDIRAVENLVADAARWGRDFQRGDASEFLQVLGEGERLLETEAMPRAAQVVFDAAGGEPGRRVATLASPYGGLVAAAGARQLLGRLERLGGWAQALGGELTRLMALPGLRQAPWWERERAALLAARLGLLAQAAATVVADARDVLGPAAGMSVDRSEGDTGDNSGDADDGEEEDLEPDEEPQDPEQDRVDELYQRALPGLAGVGAGRSNRVVFATEDGEVTAAVAARRYHFSVASAPVELGADLQWRRVRAGFGRIFYVSATLQVAGSWAFIRQRLGLGHEVDGCALPSPFDAARQARLVCFADFPSWAEHPQAAFRTVAHQLTRYACEVVRERHGSFEHGALVLTTSTAAAEAVSEGLLQQLAADGAQVPVAVAPLLGNARAAREFRDTGGFCVATRGMWQGVDFPARRLGVVWVNKLPFAPFADPVIAARRAAAAERARAAGTADPEQAATQEYYLPLAAMDLRQAVGRLLRSVDHRGVVVISDRKLAGGTALRRAYRRVFLESLDPGLLVGDPITGEAAGGNVVTMAQGWETIWRFLAEQGRLEEARAGELCTPQALEKHTVLPATLKIRQARLTSEEVACARTDGTLASLLVERCEAVAGYLRFQDEPLALKPEQHQVVRAVGEGRDVLALLPTGFGKSYTFQLPALVLPGVTVVVSPLVALMADQALELSSAVGGAVRALVGPMAESNSRGGKTEVAEQLRGTREHGIRLVYVSPERLADRRFADLLRHAAGTGVLERVAVDEAHTFVQWGDDFRPSFRRVEVLLGELRERFGVRVTAVTATANRQVREGLREGLFGLDGTSGDGKDLVTVQASPLRPELAVYRRAIRAGGPQAVAGLAERVAEACEDHAIFYCLTVKEVEALYAHLREFAVQGSQRVRRFHGRLSEAEKAAVLAEFREAPARGEEGFAPLLIVATSAFGLGVNRRDIRCVFVVSPPTDLAALYQQLGRAGRDQAGRAQSEVDVPSAGLALGTGRGLRTVAWLAAQGLSLGTLQHLGRAVLRAAASGVLDADQVAATSMAVDIQAGRLPAQQAQQAAVWDTYRTSTVRALAVLASLDTLTDLGDFPERVQITAIPDARPPADPAWRAAAVTVMNLAAQRPGSHKVTDVYALLRDHDTGTVVSDPAAAWTALATLHDLGAVDVSQAGNRRTLTAVRLTGAAQLPDAFDERMRAARERARQDLADLRTWYGDTDCATAAFGTYFAGAPVDEALHVCETSATRCSACWGRTAAAEATPQLLRALNTPRPRPTVQRDSGPYQRAVDQWVHALLWDNYRGLVPAMIRRVLRGEETYLSRRDGVRRQLWPRLLYHRLRGVDPGIRSSDVAAALERLAADGQILATKDGTVWRLRRYAEAQQQEA